MLRAVLGALLRFDSALLRAATKVAHRFQRLTGRTNFFLAKAGVTVCATSVGLSIIDFFLDLSERPKHVLILAIHLILIAWMLHLSRRIDKAEDRALSNPERSADYALHFGPGFRLFYVWMTSFGLFLWLIAEPKDPFWSAVGDSFGCGFLVFLYFVAVTPLPPSKSKIGEWVESLTAALRPAGAES